MPHSTYTQSRLAPMKAGAPGGDATTAHCTAGGTISQMLDSRDIERRAENTSFRIRRVARWTASLAINLIAGFVIAIFLGHLIEKSARNLAIDVGRAHDARW